MIFSHIFLAYIQTSRALMVSASLLGLPALALVLLAMPCVKLSQETEDTKHRRAVLGGLLILFICESLLIYMAVYLNNFNGQFLKG